MVPLSLGRATPSATERQRVSWSLTWLRPANIAATSSAETRALIRWTAMLVVLGVAIALGHVWLRLKVTDLGYRVVATRHVIEKLEGEGQELALEAARLDSPARLETVARTRLRMRPPQVGEEAVLP